MGYVFLLHFDAPVCADRPARHYLEFTSRRIEDRVNDHRSGFEYRTVPIMWAAYQRGIGFRIARVWSGATKADEKRLRDLHNNPALCPLCNPALGLCTIEYTRTSEPHEYTREIFIRTYWRTIGPKTAYGNLASIRQRQIKPARPRIRKDGPPNGAAHGTPYAHHTYADARVYTPAVYTGVDMAQSNSVRTEYVIIDGKPYDVDLFFDTY